MAERESATREPGLVLPRKFGFWTGVFAVFASMVGSGIISTTGKIVAETGSHGSNLFLWALGGMLAMCGVLTMAEMATAYPRAGGDYVYVRVAYGEPLAFLYGWAMILVGFAGPIALVSSATANYLFVPIQAAFERVGFYGLLGTASHSGLVSNQLFNQIVGSGLILFFTLSHCRGHHGSSLTQALTTIFDVAILAALAFVGLAFGQGSIENVTAVEPMSTSWIALGSSLIAVMYAYTGWNGAVYIAEELKEPSKLLPRCLIGGCLAVTVLYLLLNLTYGYALSPLEIRALPETERDRIAASSARVLLGDRTSEIFSFLIAVGRVAAISVFILTGARVVYAMSRDKLLWPRLANLHPETNVPASATVFLACLSLAFLWSGTFEQVLDFTTFGLGILCLLVVTPIFVLRRRAGYAPSFRTPLFPLPTVLFILISIAMLSASAVYNPIPAAINFGLILIGIMFYFL